MEHKSRHEFSKFVVIEVLNSSANTTFKCENKVGCVDLQHDVQADKLKFFVGDKCWKCYAFN